MLQKLFISIAILGASSSAFAMTPGQVRTSYYACMKFLTLSPAQQAKVAKRTRYSLEEVRWACNLQAEQGLDNMENCEVRYQEGYYRCW